MLISNVFYLPLVLGASVTIEPSDKIELKVSEQGPSASHGSEVLVD